MIHFQPRSEHQRKMYNNIGLTTPRGSGTNGYVTRNLSFIQQRREKQDYLKEQDVKRHEQALTKKPNKDIIEHERKREIELKCLELQDMMEDQGYEASLLFY